MNKQNYITIINQAIHDRTPYASSMASVFNTMNPEQKKYFYDIVIPYYMDGPGYNEYGSMYKDMEYMARAVQQNKDVSQILGIDFRQIGSMMSQLPDINQVQNQYAQQQSLQQSTQQQVQQPYVDEYAKTQMIQEMRQLVDQYVTHRGERMQGQESRSFAQTHHIEPNNYNVATQGWKFHISANDLSDYKRLLEVAAPEFDRLGVHYKVVTPEMFEQQCNSTQAGKVITIYPNPSFDMNNFSSELKNMLLENDGISPNGDTQIAGRIYARYGTFRGNPKEVLAQDGTRYADGRHREVVPEFVNERTPNDILNFYSNAAQRYEQTGDAKTYLQEIATMTRGKEGSNAFITLEVNMQDFGRIKGVCNEDPTQSSFIYKNGNDYYAMIHNDYANEALYKLDERGVDYVRPDWDFRYDLYEICPKDVNQAFSFVDNYNNSLQSGNSINSPTMELKQLENGRVAVQVDTALNRQFEEMCQLHGVRVACLAINEQQMEIENQFQFFKENQEFEQNEHIRA